jgi:MoxR-like ATPase
MSSDNEVKQADKKVSLDIYSEEGALLQSVPLVNGSYIIGRGEECDIQCPVASVSRQHARLLVKDGKAEIRDLNSTVGTMVNSKVVQESELFDGDVIQLGKIRFAMRCPKAVTRTSVNNSFVVPGKEEDDSFDFDRELKTLHSKCVEIKEEVGKVIVGQHEIVEGILTALLAEGHCLLIGVPGLAKTVMVCTFSKILGLETQRIQFTPDLMPSDIIGSEMLKKNKDGSPSLEFVQGPIFTQLLLADEINRTPPKTQAALLEAMQEKQVTVAMKSYHLPLPFCVIATQNPIEQEGTYPLPEAQQDRFMLCLYLDYPAKGEEIEIISRTTIGRSHQCRKIVDQNDITKFQRTVRAVGVPKEQIEYAVALTRATRVGSEESLKAGVSDLIDWGAGPRAGQAMIRGAKALAAMEGRPAVAREDVKKQALSVLRHRISCNYRARSQGIDEEEIIRRITAEVS